MSFLFCVITSLIYGWKLTLLMMLYVPAVFILNWGIGTVNKNQEYSLKIHLKKKTNRFAFVLLQFQLALSNKEFKSYCEAENIAEEVLGNIRTVVAFGGEQLEMERFNKWILKAKKARKMIALFDGFEEGITRFLFYTCNAFAFSYGIQLVLENRDKIDKEYTPSVLMIVR